ncbi:MAG: repeat protein [Acidimicrobiales bacterium]|jgi:hypothetical protein|nr:repeat protein [Acidimicrobiales bacterium]
MSPRPLPDVRPPTEDDEALERVRRRVQSIKHRRAAAGSGLTLAVLVAVTTFALRGDEPASKLVTGGGRPTSSTAPAVSSPPATVPATAPGPAASGLDVAVVNWYFVRYPIDCGATTGTKLLDVVFANPQPTVRLAIVMVACDAGAGTPGRSIFVYDHAESVTSAHLSQTLWRDDWSRLTGTVVAQGADVTTSGSTYSSATIPRCCPDGTFTARWTWTGQSYARVS